MNLYKRTPVYKGHFPLVAWCLLNTDFTVLISSTLEIVPHREFLCCGWGVLADRSSVCRCIAARPCPAFVWLYPGETGVPCFPTGPLKPLAGSMTLKHWNITKFYRDHSFYSLSELEWGCPNGTKYPPRQPIPNCAILPNRARLQTDGWTDRQTDRVIPVYPPNFVAGGIKTDTCIFKTVYSNLFFEYIYCVAY